MSTSTNDTLSQLREQIAQMAEQLTRLQNTSTTDKDPQIQDNVPATTFYPSEAEISRYPALKPSGLLSLFQEDITDDEFWIQFRSIPKTDAVGYEPPRVPPIIQNSATDKIHDLQLRALQKRIAHLTRPVDLFLHQVWSLEDREKLDAEEMVELCSTFAIFLRNNLMGVAGRINTMRKDNLRTAQGASYKDDSLQLVDPKQFQEEVKSIKMLTNAYKPRQTNGTQQKQSNNKRGNQQGYFQNKNQRESKYKRRDDNNDRRPSFHQDRSKRRGNSQQRGRSSSRRNDHSPESEAASNNS